jgi:predicted nuclease of predicted toxin-antitoxin system
VQSVNLARATDAEILSFAQREQRIIITGDTDFGTLLAAGHLASPSVILTREVTTLGVGELGALLVLNLPQFAGHLESGAIVALGRRNVRVRALPLP